MSLESPRPYLYPTQSGDPVRAPVTHDAPARIPSGVPDFDFLTGGFPIGSLVLLFGEAGAGHMEFALTSAAHLMLRFDEPKLHRLHLGSAPGPFRFPDAVAYLSTSRSESQVMDEVRSAFSGVYPEVLARHVKFRVLSPSYFQVTVVPSEWASVRSPLLSGTPASAAPDGARSVPSPTPPRRRARRTS